MLSNSYSKYERKNLSKAIISGTIIGGIIGAVVGFLYQYGFLALSWISPLFMYVPMNAIVTGTIIGIVIGIIIGSFIALLSSRGRTDNELAYVDSGKLKLHEEKLDITKERIQTAEVNMHKESITEEKTFTVPVTREELVIENKSLDNGSIETTRIPIKEERVEIVKHPVVLEDVSYHIEQFQENLCVEETVKKEQLKIDHEGSVKIVDEEVNTPYLS